jgi:hypothetical protein
LLTRHDTASKAKRDFGYAASVSVKQGIEMVVKVGHEAQGGARFTALFFCCVFAVCGSPSLLMCCRL